MFKDNNLKALAIPRRLERENIYPYWVVVEEFTKKFAGLPYKKYEGNIFPKISFYDIHGKSHDAIFLKRGQARGAFQFVTHKDLYNELLREEYSEHHSIDKWELKLSMEVE